MTRVNTWNEHKNDEKNKHTTEESTLEKQLIVVCPKKSRCEMIFLAYEMKEIIADIFTLEI